MLYQAPCILWLWYNGTDATSNKVDLSVSCWEWRTGESKAGRTSGAKCKVSSWLKIDSRAQPMRAKAASNYANAALARVEALDEGYDEAIMLNHHGMVAEGSAENVFIVKGKDILTPPPVAGILEGITRDSVIRIIRENGGCVVETDIERDDLYNADEVFMTGTAAEVKSVTQIDSVRIGTGRIGGVTKNYRGHLWMLLQVETSGLPHGLHTLDR